MADSASAGPPPNTAPDDDGWVQDLLPPEAPARPAKRESWVRDLLPEEAPPLSKRVWLLVPLIAVGLLGVIVPVWRLDVAPRLRESEAEPATSPPPSASPEPDPSPSSARPSRTPKPAKKPAPPPEPDGPRVPYAGELAAILKRDDLPTDKLGVIREFHEKLTRDMAERGGIREKDAKDVRRMVEIYGR